jgi:hypothetical protein
VRRAVARPDPTGDLLDAVLTYERSGLAPAHKAALRFADAFLAHPRGLSGESRDALLDSFSTEQIVELTFKLVYWSCNKASTALGSDAPVDPDALTEFSYDESGAFVLQLAVTASAPDPSSPRGSSAC